MDFSIPILKTKLTVPALKATNLRRERLVQQLNDGTHSKFTLISAPAGFGKTTLLTEWLQTLQTQVAWISLDERDNDISRYMKYLATALQSLFKDIQLPSMNILQAPGTSVVDKPPVEYLLISIINALSDSPQRFVLILDDYHLITESGIHKAMLFLLDNMPQNMHLVLASRTDPPWPLARYRARREMNELRIADLRFNASETNDFITERMLLKLDKKETKVLEVRTEGWIAGLQMAALSMRGRDDTHGYIRTLSGTNRFILDFLTEEVLDQQAPEVREFLLITSILERINAELCDAVTDGRDSHALLSMIEQSNLFILPMDNEREWFRYHNLFADLLRNMLEHEQPDMLPIYHQRASAWYEENGFFEEAIQHAFKTGDQQNTLKLVEQHARSAFMHGEFNLLYSWFDQLPRELLFNSSRASLDFAWVLLERGEIQLCRELIDKVNSGIDAEDDEKRRAALTGEIAILRAELAINEDWQQANLLSRQALEQIPEDRLFLRSIAYFTLALSYNMCGMVEEALEHYPGAVDRCRDAGNYLMAMQASLDYAMLLLWCGRINEAKTFCHQTLLWVTENQLEETPAVSTLFVALGRIYYEQNELARASEYLQKSTKLSHKGGLELIRGGEIYMMHVLNALGFPQKANTLYQNVMKRITPTRDVHYNEEAIETHRAILDVKQGNNNAAYQWALRVLNRKEARPEWLESFQKLTLGIVLLAYSYKEPQSENLDIAVEQLDELIDLAKERGMVREIIRAEVVKSIILSLQGQEEEALALLQNVLPGAAEQGYYRIFIDLGEMGVPLLRKLKLSADLRAFTSKIFVAIESEKQGKPLTTIMKEQPLVEPLSEREIEVLRYLTSSLTSTEIADELYIAASTVRSHIKSIYGKLNVHRRSEAVTRARELGLI